MKKIYLLISTVVLYYTSFAQTTLYTNNFEGSFDATTAAAQASTSSETFFKNGSLAVGWNNSANQGSSNTWAITSIGNTSKGYTGASGGYYLKATIPSGSVGATIYYYAMIGPINTTGYQSITLNFGATSSRTLNSISSFRTSASGSGSSPYGAIGATVVNADNSANTPVVPTTTASTSTTTQLIDSSGGATAWGYYSVPLATAVANNNPNLYVYIQFSYKTPPSAITLSFDDISITGTPIATRTWTGKIYKSVQDGLWSSASTWNYSTDSTNWSAASAAPDYQDSSIVIGNKVSITSSVSLNQVKVISGGTLQLGDGTTDGIMTLIDEPNDELEIRNGGVFQVLNVTNSYSTGIVYYSAGVSYSVNTGGIIRIGNSTAVSNSYCGLATYANGIWQDKSIFDWNSTNAPTSSNFFPNVSWNVSPIFRFSYPFTTLGSSSTSYSPCVNGTVDLNNVNLTYTGTFTKVIRDGITGTGTINNTGKLYVCGYNASIGAGITFNPIATSSVMLVQAVNFAVNGTVHGQVQLDPAPLNSSGTFPAIYTQYSSGTTPTLTLSGTNTNFDSLYVLTTTPISGFTPTLSLSNSTGVNNLLSLVNGGNIITNNNLTLKSASSGSAVFIDTTGTFTGNVVVQRYVGNTTPTQQWRMIGFPLLKTTSISASTLAGLFGTGYKAYTYNEAADDQTNYGNSGTVNAGWTAFVSPLTTTADKGILMSGGTPGTILSATGTLNTGAQSIALSFSKKGWNFISNPYAFNINWTTIAANNSGVVNNAIYRYDPSSTAYATYVGGSSTGNQSNVIQNGAGFFVQAKAAGNLSIAESDKTTGAVLASLMGYQPIISQDNSIIKLSLQKQGDQYSDEVVLRWGGGVAATDNFDGDFDAYDLGRAVGPDLSVVGNDKTVYSIFHGSELKSSSNENRTVQLGMKNMEEGTYQIGIQLQSPIANGNKAYLYDSYSNTYTLIDGNTNTYSFVTTADAKSQSATRFSVVMNVKETVAINDNTNLPVSLLNNPSTGNILTLYSKNNYTKLQWQVVDNSGRLLQSGLLGNVTKGTTYQINAGNTSTGNYFIKLNGDGNALPVLKAIKN